jgi:hypothetical protein
MTEAKAETVLAFFGLISKMRGGEPVLAYLLARRVAEAIAFSI